MKDDIILVTLYHSILESNGTAVMVMVIRNCGIMLIYVHKYRAPEKRHTVTRESTPSDYSVSDDGKIPIGKP